MSSERLHIQMFGEFRIQNDYHSFTPTSGKGTQVTALITYLIANKEVEISKDKLTEILWPEEEISNPTGALRNLVYRARQELDKFFPVSHAECILFKRNSYMWNRDIPCETDIDRFETLFNLAQKEPSADQQLHYYEEMFRLYQGNFLPAQAHDDWVMFRSVYYQNLYVKCVLQICRHLKEEGQYQQLIDLCEQANQKDLMAESIYREVLEAYLLLNRPHRALDYYRSVLNLFNTRYGVDVSEYFSDIYQQILTETQNKQLNIEDLEDHLREDKNSRGSFYCNYDIFKNIYQINMRSLRRVKSKRYLVLMTLREKGEPNQLSDSIHAEMQILRDVIHHNLRRNDIFTQSSYSQYSLILMVPGEAGCRVAIDRVRARYEENRQNPSVQLEIDIREIT